MTNVDRENVVRYIEDEIEKNKILGKHYAPIGNDMLSDVLNLLKEQEDLGTELTNAVELIRKKNERIEKLLKEQEAVVPYQHDAVWLCGNCEKEVVGWDDDIDGKEYRYPFCRQCGQAVKWE